MSQEPDFNSLNRKLWNFGAGPGKLPEVVLERVRNEWFNWNDTHMNILEISHRSVEFEQLIDKAEKNLRLLMHIPSNYRVLFLQGGATTQFSAIPLNFLGKTNAKVDYCVTGAWSDKAAQEATRYTQNIHYVVDRNTTNNYTKLPPVENLKFSDDAVYAYYCSNETIHGLEFPDIPRPPTNVPLIVDMSSNFLTHPIDVSRFGMIYAGAQKNVGPAGLVIAIIRENLLLNITPLSYTPLMLDYRVQTHHRSMYNTPPTFSIYFAGLVFEWLIEQGGLEVIQEHTRKKAQLIDHLIDTSEHFYTCPVDPYCRSSVNVCFRIKDGQVPEEEHCFLSLAQQQGLLQLEGHCSVRGLRASLYNAMPIEGVEQLVKLMRNFQITSSVDSSSSTTHL